MANDEMTIFGPKNYKIKDPRMNPPVVDSITENIQFTWLGDMKVQLDYVKNTGIQERNFVAVAVDKGNANSDVLYHYITDFTEDYYGGIRPVIRVKK